jgi:tetratricopeptide (TPR) repeat protein
MEKFYYYVSDDEKRGPFSLEELKSKRLKKSTLVWTEGLENWVIADQMEELKGFLVAEPPPIPKKIEPYESRREIKPTIKRETKKAISTPIPRKHTDLVVLGILLGLTNLILFYQTEGFSSWNESNVIPISVALFFSRIVVMVSVIYIAREKNRNTFGWGLFAFNLPTIAIISIALLKEKPISVKISKNFSKVQQINSLLEEAQRYFGKERYSDCILVSDAILEADSNQPVARFIRAVSKENLGSFSESEDDFSFLIDNGRFVPESFFYLGRIEEKKNDLHKAIDYWMQSFKMGNDKARKKLDVYHNFNGQFLLSQKDAFKKLDSSQWIEIITDRIIRYAGGLKEIDDLLNGEEVSTNFMGFENGILIKLFFKENLHWVVIGLHEINDIGFERDNFYLNIDLLRGDKIIFQFDEINPNTENQIIDICERIREQTGKELSLLKNYGFD